MVRKMSLSEKMYRSFKEDIDFISIGCRSHKGFLNIDQLLMRSRAFIDDETLEMRAAEDLYLYLRACWARSSSIDTAYSSLNYHINCAQKIVHDFIEPKLFEMKDAIEINLKTDLETKLCSRDIDVNMTIDLDDEIYYTFMSQLMGIIYQANCLIDYSIRGVKLLISVVHDKYKKINTDPVVDHFLNESEVLFQQLNNKLRKIEGDNKKEGMIIRQRNYFLHNAFINPRVSKYTKEIVILFSNNDSGVDSQGAVTFGALCDMAESLIQLLNQEFERTILAHLELFIKYDKIIRKH